MRVAACSLDSIRRWRRVQKTGEVTSSPRMPAVSDAMTDYAIAALSHAVDGRLLDPKSRGCMLRCTTWPGPCRRPGAWSSSAPVWR